MERCTYAIVLTGRPRIGWDPDFVRRRLVAGLHFFTPEHFAPDLGLQELCINTRCGRRAGDKGIFMRGSRRTAIRTGLVILALTGAGQGWAVAAPPPSCKFGREMRLADSAIDRVTSWTALRRWQRQYGNCDDGETAEAVDDTVTALLTRRWTELMQNGGVVEGDAGFRSFVLRHIDAVGFDDQPLRQVEASARARCTPGNRQLCAQVRDALGKVGQ